MLHPVIWRQLQGKAMNVPLLWGKTARVGWVPQGTLGDALPLSPIWAQVFTKMTWSSHHVDNSIKLILNLLYASLVHQPWLVATPYLRTR